MQNTNSQWKYHSSAYIDDNVDDGDGDNNGDNYDDNGNGDKNDRNNSHRQNNNVVLGFFQFIFIFPDI